MDLKEIKKQGRKCKTLAEVFDLELSIDTSNGTPMDVQDYLRQLKCDTVVKGLRKYNLDNAEKFYNYSMRGYCQLFYETYMADRLKSNLDSLSDEFEVTVALDARMDAAVLCLGDFKDFDK